MVTGKLVGLFAGLALATTAGAQESSQKDDNSGSPKASGSSGNADQGTSGKTSGPSGEYGGSGMQHQLSKNELTGRVVRAENNMVWIDHLGAVVPLRIDANTKFESAGVTHARDLKEGQEIRANFTVKDKTTNVATAIWLEGATSTGKAGADSLDMQPRSNPSAAAPGERGNGQGKNPGGSQ
jgi:hypothetical protein